LANAGLSDLEQFFIDEAAAMALQKAEKREKDEQDAALIDDEQFARPRRGI
jgi:hypothetical protein